jgi:hypothetical protein
MVRVELREALAKRIVGLVELVPPKDKRPQERVLATGQT